MSEELDHFPRTPPAGTWDQCREWVLRELTRIARNNHKIGNDSAAGQLEILKTLAELKEDLKEGQNKLKDELMKGQTGLAIDIAMLKVKAGVWGMLGGSIVAVGMLLLSYAKHG